MTLGPAVPDPGAIYTIGLNYRRPGAPGTPRPPRPLVYGKAADLGRRARRHVALGPDVTPNVDAEVELGVVVGGSRWRAVFGYTIIDDVSSRDAWLDGDQWLLGKSMAGFCPVGPWIVTADEFDPTDSDSVARSTTSRSRTADRRDALRDRRGARVPQPAPRAPAGRPDRDRDTAAPDDAARTGPAPPRGRLVTCWIEGIGELTTTVA